MSKRIYLNIKDFNEQDFCILQQLGFKSIAGGVVAFNDIKIGLDQLNNINSNIKILKSWVMINNSSDINPDSKNKYQAYVWIKLIKRTERVPMKQLIGIFTALHHMQISKEYKQKYSKLFCERINKTELSEDWKDRFIRTIK